MSNLLHSSLLLLLGLKKVIEIKFNIIKNLKADKFMMK